MHTWARRSVSGICSLMGHGTLRSPFPPTPLSTQSPGKGRSSASSKCHHQLYICAAGCTTANGRGASCTFLATAARASLGPVVCVHSFFFGVYVTHPSHPSCVCRSVASAISFLLLLHLGREHAIFGARKYRHITSRGARSECAYIGNG